jgi:hypothetical protein
MDNNNNVHRSERLPVQSKGLPDGPLQSIAVDCARKVAFGNRNTEAGALFVVGEVVNRETGGPEALTDLQYWLKGVGANQPRLPVEGVRRAQMVVKRARPLARRALSTRRPFLVAMRARKP